MCGANILTCFGNTVTHYTFTGRYTSAPNEYHSDSFLGGIQLQNVQVLLTMGNDLQDRGVNSDAYCYKACQIFHNIAKNFER